MDIIDFTNKARLSKRETDVCIKVYKDTEKTEAEWRIELEGKVTFPTTDTAPKEVEAVEAEIAPSDETDAAPPTTKEIARKKVEEIKQNKNKKDE